jgi:hypothetical protein
MRALVYRLAGGTASFVGLEPATVSSQPLCLTLSPALGMAALAHPPGLKGHTEALEGLAVEMLARGLSVRDIEDAFKDETGRLLLSRTAVSEIGQQLWEDDLGPGRLGRNPHAEGDPMTPSGNYGATHPHSKNRASLRALVPVV